MVPKKAGKYRLINAAQRLNAVTIKDASLPPSADDFSEEFARFPLLSLSDLCSGYDQCIRAPESRDMTPFMTPFGLLRMTTLPRGYTNGVQVFDRVIRKVLRDVISENREKPFIDDIAVKLKMKSYFRDSNGRPQVKIRVTTFFFLKGPKFLKGDGSNAVDYHGNSTISF